MPYNPSEHYIGGQLIGAGIQQFGQSVADTITKLDDSRKLDAYNDAIAQQALNSGKWTHEDYDKYVGSSRTQKTGMVAGLTADFVDKWKQSQADYREKIARGNLYGAQAQGYRDLYPQTSATGTTNLQPVIGPDGKPVPGIGVARFATKGGGIRSQVVPVPQQGSPYVVGPNGELQIRTPKGTTRPPTQQELSALQQQGVTIPGAKITAPAQPTPTPAPGFLD